MTSNSASIRVEEMAEYMEACAQIARNGADIYPKSKEKRHHADLVTAIAEYLRAIADSPDSSDETTAYEELRKRATRLIVAMRRDRWEGHDHGYANDLAALLNVGSPENGKGEQT